jgi:hypothetical protein
MRPAPLRFIGRAERLPDTTASRKPTIPRHDHDAINPLRSPTLGPGRPDDRLQQTGGTLSVW